MIAVIARKFRDRRATRLQNISTSFLVRCLLSGLMSCMADHAALANRYRGNPDRAVNSRAEAWTSPVGRLETTRQVVVDGVQGVFKGTGFLISPCYVVTAAHVVSPDSDALLTGVIDPRTDFRMIFRVINHSSSASMSAITNIDRPLNDLKVQYLKVAAGSATGSSTLDAKDFIFLRLPEGRCFGANPDIGWFEAATADLSRGNVATALGFPKGPRKGELHLGAGKIGDVVGTGLLEFSGSYKVGESGGPVIVLEEGRLKVAGLIASHLGSEASQEYPTYSRDNSNLILSLIPILNYPPIKALVDADKNRFGNPNPATARQFTGELSR